MPLDEKAPKPSAPSAASDTAAERHPPPTAAQRALAEADARRAERDHKPASTEPLEVNGRGGLDPTRYGDWEINGLTSDF
jgi:hypothetical protein